MWWLQAHQILLVSVSTLPRLDQLLTGLSPGCQKADWSRHKKVRITISVIVNATKTHWLDVQNCGEREVGKLARQVLISPMPSAPTVPWHMWAVPPAFKEF